jgi:translation initiation factor IF-3
MSQEKHNTRKRTWKQLNERDRIKIERKPKLEGRNMIMVLNPVQGGNQSKK